MMFPHFHSYIRAHAALTDAQFDRLIAPAIERKLLRNEFLLQEGQVCRHKSFVMEGLLRTYGVSPDGSETILQFSPENTWTIDAESYDRQQPTTFNIAAIEESVLLMWNKSDFERLLIEIPALKLFSQQLISSNIYSGRQRLFTTLSGTPEERYDDYQRRMPELSGRLPLHMIAAYLGISLKTLTRIRHSQLNR